MRKVVNYIFLVLGLVYMISGLLLLFQQDTQDTYSVFFGWELSKNGYVLYKVLVGAVLVLITIVDLRLAGGDRSRKN